MVGSIRLQITLAYFNYYQQPVNHMIIIITNVSPCHQSLSSYEMYMHLNKKKNDVMTTDLLTSY